MFTIATVPSSQPTAIKVLLEEKQMSVKVTPGGQTSISWIRVPSVARAKLMKLSHLKQLAIMLLLWDQERDLTLLLNLDCSLFVSEIPVMISLPAAMLLLAI